MSLVNKVLWFVTRGSSSCLGNDTGGVDAVVVCGQVTPSMFSGFRLITWPRTLDRTFMC